MSLSQLARSIAQSPTLKLNEEARLLRERGEPVIHLGIGEPKNKAPIAATLSAAARLNGGEIKYSPTDGLPSLKQAILRYTEENYGKVVGPENVIVCAGAKQALWTLLYTLVNPQEEVVLVAPYWVSYPEMVRMMYGVPVIVTPEDGRFQPRLAEIEKAVSGYTKALILNSPNNPSGVLYPADFVAEVVDFCERRNIYLIMDDIYHRLVFDGKRPPSAYQFARRDLESSRVITLNGVSKLYGLTGVRVGWVIAPRAIVEVMTNVQAQTATCVSVVQQAAAEGALTGLQSAVDNLRLTIQNNRDVMLRELRSFDGVTVARPDGTFYCFPDFRAYGQSSEALAQFLLRKAMVVTVPGKEFGLEGHLRLSFAGTVKDVTEGVARMKWALDPNAPNEIYVGNRKLVRDWL